MQSKQEIETNNVMRSKKIILWSAAICCILPTCLLEAGNRKIADVSDKCAGTKHTSTIIQPNIFHNVEFAKESTDDTVYQINDAYKSGNNNNPISPFLLGADPTAIEYNGRLYVYATNDQQQFDATKGQSSNNYSRITSFNVYSTADMTNWTHHGTIDMKATCPWIYTSWAPSIISRVEKDKKTHFYLYFTNSAGGIGVVTSTSPVGPWKDPLGHALIDGNTRGLGSCSSIIDPGVTLDDEGNGWLTFGGGNPNNTGSDLQPGNARIVKLGANLISLASDIVPIPAPYHFEANELNFINGKWVFSYCSSWSSRNAWTSYMRTVGAPSTCSIVYMVSEDPLNPESWKYRDQYFKNPGNFGYAYGNNHTHIQKFGNNWYIVYHTEWLSNKMGYSGGYRNISINKIAVNETLAKIVEGKPTDTGAPTITTSTINPFELQQAETMANAAGIKVEKTAKSGNTLVSSIDPGDWILVRNVNFGTDIANSISLSLKGSGQVEVRLDKIGNQAIAVCDFSQTVQKVVEVPLTTEVTGKHTIYFLFTKGTTGKFDTWQFTSEADAINDITMDSNDNNVNESIYDITGRHITTPSQNGIYIINRKKIIIK